MAVSKIHKEQFSSFQIQIQNLVVPANISAWYSTVDIPDNAVSINGYYIESIWCTLRSLTFNRSTGKIDICLRNWSTSEVTTSMVVDIATN